MKWLKKDALQIIGFQSYGTADLLFLRGRALEDEDIDLSKKGFFNLIRNTYKRFETDEVRHTKIGVRLSEKPLIITETDAHGYFRLEMVVEDLYSYANTEGWVALEFSFQNTDIKREIRLKNRFPCEMLIPSKTAKFGVISDIDDTILHTGVVSLLKWQVIINTIFKRATKRSALEGVSNFYNQLHHGVNKNEANPMFYVSHSPWNLYRYLELFLQTNNFPKGPILLRSMASFRAKNRPSAAPQKYHEIVNILETYPKLGFILIGDSGEKDGDIYIDIAKKFPSQIKAIYLRSVRHDKRVERVTALFNEYTKVPFLLVRKTEEAYSHAKEAGFI